MLRGFSRVLPIFTTPFLLRTIGLENFGIIEFIKAFCFYFIIFADYGFNYSATRQISLHREKKERVKEIISTVFVIKALFLSVSCVFIFLFIQFVPTVQNVKWPLLLYFPVLICQTFFPIFVFQGLEKMKLMTLINVFGKCLFLIAMIGWIRQPEDYLYYPLFLSIAESIRLLIGLYFLIKLASFRFTMPNKKQILFQLQEGFAIFASMLSINFYSRLPAVFLGFFGGPIAVGIYSSSIRIIRSTLGLIDPLTQALFPLASRKIHQDRPRGIEYVFQSLKYSAIVTASLGLIYFLFAKPILIFMAGDLLPQALQILRWHSFLPLIIVLSNIVGIQLLIPLGRKRAYSLTMMFTAVIAFVLLWILTPIYGALGSAIAIFGGEFFATCLMFWFYYRTSQKSQIERTQASL